MKRKTYVSLIFVLILTVVAACASPATTPQTPTVPSTSPTPYVSPTTTVVAPEYVISLINQFVQENNINPSTVTYVSSEQVDWPDGCLGVVRIGYMCAMVITPGYRILINVNSLTIELHTNLDGSAILLAPLSTADVQPLYIDWTDELAPCTEAQVSDQTLFLGSCGQNLSALAPLTDTQKTQLLDWVHTYAGFVAETPNGTLAFYGQGGQVPDVTIQNEIATWLDGIVEGTSASSLPGVVVISYSRAGGIAGFCDSVTVTSSGVVSALSCKSNVTPKPEDRLTQLQIEKLSSWLSMYQSTEIVQKDNATADSMTVKLNFSGQGSQPVPDEVKLEMLGYVSQLLARLD